MAFDRPVRCAHEAIELTKLLIGHQESDENASNDSGRVEYDGEIFPAADFPALDSEVSIYHAALGRANRRVVARLCDGWIPHNIPFPEVDIFFTYIAGHAEKAERDPADITVAPYVPAAVAEDPDIGHNAIRSYIAYHYFWGLDWSRGDLGRNIDVVRPTRQNLPRFDEVPAESDVSILM